jgi:Coenzyme PQQ synthesis protein D (PqqD)
MSWFRTKTDEIVWRVVDGEAVLVHADTSAYYGLNATGTYVWEAIATASLTPEEISRRLSARYGVAAETVRRDVDTFLASLGRETLVLESPGPDGDLNGTPAAGDETLPAGQYEPPTLTRFGELEQLVLSGE